MWHRVQCSATRCAATAACLSHSSSLLISLRALHRPTTPLYTTGKVQVRIYATDGQTFDRSYEEGANLMEALRDDPTLPIDAAGACNGTCQCSTCHILLHSSEWCAKVEKLFPVTDAEQDCLDKAPGVTAASRLGCQLTLTEEMDGMEMDLPTSTLDVRWQAAYKRSVKK